MGLRRIVRSGRHLLWPSFFYLSEFAFSKQFGAVKVQLCSIPMVRATKAFSLLCDFLFWTFHSIPTLLSAFLFPLGKRKDYIFTILDPLDLLSYLRFYKSTSCFAEGTFPTRRNLHLDMRRRRCDGSGPICYEIF